MKLISTTLSELTPFGKFQYTKLYEVITMTDLRPHINKNTEILFSGINLNIGHRYFKKIRDIQIVGSYGLIAPCNFQSVVSSTLLWLCVIYAVSKLQKGDVRSGSSN